MAHIKCRYFEYRCGVGRYDYFQKRCEYPQQNDECKYFEGHWFEEDKQMWAIKEICGNTYRSYTEFEGDYKKYEVDDFELWIPRRHTIGRGIRCIPFLSIIDFQTEHASPYVGTT